MLILYHKYAATALVGFLFFHTIHYVTCLRAEFIIYTLAGRMLSAMHKLFGFVPVRYLWQMPVRDGGKGCVYADPGGSSLFLVYVFWLHLKCTSVITYSPFKKCGGQDTGTRSHQETGRRRSGDGQSEQFAAASLLFPVQQAVGFPSKILV